MTEFDAVELSDVVNDQSTVELLGVVAMTESIVFSGADVNEIDSEVESVLALIIFTPREIFNSSRHGYRLSAILDISVICPGGHALSV